MKEKKRNLHEKKTCVHAESWKAWNHNGEIIQGSKIMEMSWNFGSY